MYISEDDKKKILDRTSDKLAEVIGQFTTLSKHGTVKTFSGLVPFAGRTSSGSMKTNGYSVATNASKSPERHLSIT